MPVPVVRPVDEVIDEEHGYLFQNHESELQSPQWALASCRDSQPEIFFPISAGDVRNREAAVSYCASCAIRTQCLELAMRDRSLVGIWGGTDEVDRARLRGHHLVVVR